MRYFLPQKERVGLGPIPVPLPVTREKVNLYAARELLQLRTDADLVQHAIKHRTISL